MGVLYLNLLKKEILLNPTIELEKELWESGYMNICGIDEVGRGPLAGPVVVGAVNLSNEDQVLEGVRDSKTMTQKKREYFFEKIKEVCFWGIGIVESFEIDELGLTEGIKKAVNISLKNLEDMMGRKPDFLLIDGGFPKFSKYKVKSVNGGDSLHYSISAASVIAKVTRDRLMMEYSKKYPEYGFEKHVGYGTKGHLEALDKYGPCEIHRKCFKPVAKFFS
jgi:ribonuclease HII